MKNDPSPSDAAAELIESISNGECVQFDENDNGDLVVFKCPAEVFSTLSNDVTKMHIISFFDRPGAGYYFNYLEQTHFPPSREENKEYEFRICKWVDMLWIIGSIPLAKKELAIASAEATKMRLGDGIPTVIGTGELGHIPGIEGDYPMSVFPISCNRAFTLECASESPMYQGPGGSQDAHVESEFKTKQLFEEKLGPDGYEQYLKRIR